MDSTVARQVRAAMVANREAIRAGKTTCHVNPEDLLDLQCYFSHCQPLNVGPGRAGPRPPGALLNMDGCWLCPDETLPRGAHRFEE